MAPERPIDPALLGLNDEILEFEKALQAKRLTKNGADIYSKLTKTRPGTLDRNLGLKLNEVQLPLPSEITGVEDFVAYLSNTLHDSNQNLAECLHLPPNKVSYAIIEERKAKLRIVGEGFMITALENQDTTTGFLSIHALFGDVSSPEAKSLIKEHLKGSQLVDAYHLLNRITGDKS